MMVAAGRMRRTRPGPGERGGEVVFFGSPDALKASATLTADYLSGRRRAGAKPGTDHGFPQNRGLSLPKIELLGATDHNLKDIDVALPLGPPSASIPATAAARPAAAAASSTSRCSFFRTCTCAARTATAGASAAKGWERRSAGRHY